MTERPPPEATGTGTGIGVGLKSVDSASSVDSDPPWDDFGTLFEFLPIGAYRASPEGRMLRANPAQVSLNGYDSEAEMLDAVQDIGTEWYVDPDRRRQFWELLERDDFVKSFESEIYRHKTRERIWITENAHLVYDGNGRILFCEGTAEEITDRVLAQAKLQRSERELRQIIDLVPHMIFASDQAGRFLLANKAVAELYGRTVEQLVGTRLDLVDPNPDPVRYFLQTDQEVIRSGKTVVIAQVEVTDASGRKRLHQATKIPFHFAGQSAVLGVAVDITEQRQIEQELRRSQERFEQIFDASPLPIMLTRARDARLIAVNRAFELTSGWSREEAVGKTTLEIGAWMSEADRQRWAERLATHKRVVDHELTLRDRSGNVHTVLANGELIEIDGETCILSNIQDISQRKRVENELRTSNQHLHTIIAGCPLAIYSRDREGRVTSWNPAAERIYGWSADEAIGQTLLSVPADAAVASAELRMRVLGGEMVVQANARRQRKDGALIDISATMAPLRDGADQTYGYVTIAADVTELRKSEALIWQQANFDALTGLPNRRMLRDRLAQGMMASRRSGSGLALLFLDLDHFKEVNDTLGHDRGDLLLVEAARRIRGCVRESDTVARLGGDEFTVLLPEMREQGRLEAILQSIMLALSQPFDLGAEQPVISVSIGVALYPGDASDIEDLFKHADQAMYQAKAAGRNCFRHFTPALQEAAQTRMRLVSDLRGVVAAGQLRIVYQPVVELASGVVRKAEALIRWQHPVRGLVNPQEFIPIAESSGAIVEIGDWVFEQAALQLRRCRELHHPEFQISVNKSPAQFHQAAQSQQQWIARLAELGLPGQSLVVEITEGLLMDAHRDVKGQLSQLRGAGIRVSMDDFGTGYSSLAYLQDYDIDYLKIDRSFVSDLKPQSKNLALCAAIIAMAHALGLKVIAEGVETADQRDWLRGAGCDFGQGYLFAKPLDASALEAWLAGRRT